MTEGNSQTRKDNKTRERFYLEHWFRERVHEIKNRTF